MASTIKILEALYPGEWEIDIDKEPGDPLAYINRSTELCVERLIDSSNATDKVMLRRKPPRQSTK